MFRFVQFIASLHVLTCLQPVAQSFVPQEIGRKPSGSDSDASSCDDAAMMEVSDGQGNIQVVLKANCLFTSRLTCHFAFTVSAQARPRSPTTCDGTAWLWAPPASQTALRKLIQPDKCLVPSEPVSRSTRLSGARCVGSSWSRLPRHDSHPPRRVPHVPRRPSDMFSGVH